MVCDRCISAVQNIFINNGIEDVHVVLGEVQFENEGQYQQQIETIQSELLKEGFELVLNEEEQLVNQIKSLLIEAIHQKQFSIDKLSDFVPAHLNKSYASLSQLFSKMEGKTIEQFMIEHKIERAKELLSYGELTISEVSYSLNYSSPQHFSRQFKKITGVTPSSFEHNSKRKKLDKI